LDAEQAMATLPRMGKPEISTGTNLQAKKSPLAKCLRGKAWKTHAGV